MIEEKCKIESSRVSGFFFHLSVSWTSGMDE